MANKDYYSILGVSKTATDDEIKSAYRKLAKKYHPDINKEPDAEAKFKEVQEAYDILYDDQKRQTYDQFGHAAFEQGAGQGGFGGSGFSGAGFGDINLDDIFQSFFGGGRRSTNRNATRRGEDSLMRVRISFMDAIMGKTITINVTYDETCPKCNGSGAKTPNDIQTCSHCHGRGYINVEKRTLFGMMQSQETCPVCNGKGKIITDKCDNCGGKGYVRIKKDIEVKIPAGINNGQQIRIPGKGGRGQNGGENGDLFLEIVVSPHNNFKREGNNIHIDIPISFIDAALGCTVDCPTVYGDVEVKIPAGTQPGTTLKLRGRGVKDLRSQNPGDQFIHIDVKTPENLSKEQKELLTKFKESTKESWFDKFKKSFKK